jgi:hypothetical protein
MRGADVHTASSVPLCSFFRQLVMGAAAVQLNQLQNNMAVAPPAAAAAVAAPLNPLNPLAAPTGRIAT